MSLTSSHIKVLVAQGLHKQIAAKPGLFTYCPGCRTQFSKIACIPDLLVCGHLLCKECQNCPTVMGCQACQILQEDGDEQQKKTIKILKKNFVLILDMLDGTYDRMNPTHYTFFSSFRNFFKADVSPEMQDYPFQIKDMQGKSKLKIVKGKTTFGQIVQSSEQLKIYMNQYQGVGIISLVINGITANYSEIKDKKVHEFHRIKSVKQQICNSILLYHRKNGGLSLKLLAFQQQWK